MTPFFLSETTAGGISLYSGIGAKVVHNTDTETFPGVVRFAKDGVPDVAKIRITVGTELLDKVNRIHERYKRDCRIEVESRRMPCEFVN